LTEAARAEYLASEEGRRAVTVSLVAEVMSTYFELLEQDLELDIGQRTSGLAANSIRLVELRRQAGAASGLDVRQAEQLQFTAAAQIAASRRNITQTEDALSLLQGGIPAAQQRSRKLEEIAIPPQVPPGLPSELLARRPDILQAEQNLIAANAQIGAARALYFPHLSLTAFAGGESRGLLDLASGPARVYTIAPSALQSVFHAGQIRSQIRATESQHREMLIGYQRAVYTALRETSRLIDPHTAVGLAVAEKETRDPAVPMIVLGTAHPAKFPEAVEAACGVRPGLPDWLSDLPERPERATGMPVDQAAIEKFILAASRAAREGAAA
jgi:multidrug efflux system outer membrane protein